MWKYFLRSKAFTATGCNEVLSDDQPRENGVLFHRFGDSLPPSALMTVDYNVILTWLIAREDVIGNAIVINTSLKQFQLILEP
jgi:hypothetical protein